MYASLIAAAAGLSVTKEKGDRRSAMLDKYNVNNYNQGWEVVTRGPWTGFLNERLRREGNSKRKMG